MRATVVRDQSIHPDRRAQLIWLLLLVIAGATSLLWLGPLRHPAPISHPHRLSWVLLASLFYLAEINVVHVHMQRETHSFSLSEIPLVLGLYFAGPAGLVSAQVAGATAALIVHRRQNPQKLAFNAAQLAFSASLAATVFGALAPGGHLAGPEGWGAAFVAAAASALAGMLAITAAIALLHGRLVLEKLPEVAALGLLAAGTNASLGLVGITVMWSEPSGGWLLLVPAGAIFLGYRAYVREHAQRRGLQFLYDSMHMLQRPSQVDAALRELLTHTASVFRAEISELTLFPDSDGASAVRVTLGPADHVEATQYLDVADAEVELARRAAAAGGLLLLGTTRDEHIGDGLVRRHLRDAMVAALPGEQAPIGFMLLGNRLDDVSHFDAEDLRLFATLAGHVAVAVQNGQLERSVDRLRTIEQRLKRQALHDSLTDLANRTLFADRVEHALARRCNQPVAAMFIDLDDFKQVNDRHGHAAGDEVLVAVAHRIRACLRPADTAARLGGDEFAVLLDESSAHDASRVAERLVDVLCEPLVVDGREIAVGASIGVTLGVPGTTGAVELLAAADAAMYEAKAAGKRGFVVHYGELAVGHERVGVIRGGAPQQGGGT